MNRAWWTVALVVSAAGCSHSKREPAAAESRRESGYIEIGAQAQRNFGLQVEAAEIHELNEYLLVPGTVQPTDSRVVTVRPLARGRLHDVLVRVGDRVRKGQTLATYDNIEAGELTAQLAGASAELERLRLQERNLGRQTDRARALADIGAVPKKELEQALADQQGAQQSIKSQESLAAGMLARLRRFGISPNDGQGPLVTAITSPFAGVVTKQDASPGEVVESTSALFTIADLTTVWVQAEVYEKDLGRLRLGQRAFITVDTYPNRQFTGTVAYVSDFLDPRTRTARVRCEVPNGAIQLKLEMYANVNLPTTFSRRALAVRTGAIQEVGGKAVVFVPKAATQFEMRWVSAGHTVGDLVEITGGLKEGEPVVIAGAFHLKSVLVGKDLGED
jgi:membrane fusion protein, heavy metal efflux system